MTFEDIKNWKPLDKMESIDPAELHQRIEDAYYVEMPHFKTLHSIPYIGEAEVVEYNTDEFIALCPVTFLPDFHNLRILYSPNNYIVELKSLKYYLLDYKDLPISHEHLASKLYSDLYNVLKPASMLIILTVGIRGGIETIIKIGDEELE